MHAKTISIGQNLSIDSFDPDCRSAYLETETIPVIEYPRPGQELRSYMKDHVKIVTWHVC